MADLNPQPLPPAPVEVLVPGEVTFDLVKMQKITADVLAKSGCPACHSGLDIRFRRLDQFVVDPETLEVRHALGGPA